MDNNLTFYCADFNSVINKRLSNSIEFNNIEDVDILVFDTYSVKTYKGFNNYFESEFTLITDDFRSEQFLEQVSAGYYQLHDLVILINNIQFSNDPGDLLSTGFSLAKNTAKIVIYDEFYNATQPSKIQHSLYELQQKLLSISLGQLVIEHFETMTTSDLTSKHAYIELRKIQIQTNE